MFHQPKSKAVSSVYGTRQQKTLLAFSNKSAYLGHLQRKLSDQSYFKSLLCADYYEASSQPDEVLREQLAAR